MDGIGMKIHTFHAKRSSLVCKKTKDKVFQLAML